MKNAHCAFKAQFCIKSFVSEKSQYLFLGWFYSVNFFHAIKGAGQL